MKELLWNLFRSTGKIEYYMKYKEIRKFWNRAREGGRKSFRLKIKVIALGKHTETLEELVIYEELDTQEIWIRPLSMFLSKVDHEKYPEVKQEYRFEEDYD